MLYCKPQHAFYDLAADIMAENSDLVGTSLSKVSAVSCIWFGPSISIQHTTNDAPMAAQYSIAHKASRCGSYVT